MSGRFLLPGLLIPLALALCVPSASAQEIRGKVLERGSRAPLGGALVSLLSEDGEEVGRTLSAPDGTYRIEAPAGSYRLRVERIGFATWTSEAIRLEPGDVLTHPVEVPTRAVPLTSLAVEADGGRCRTRPEAGQAAARLWEEARKALRATQVTREEREAGFRVRRYELVLTPGLDTVEEHSTVAGGVRGNPFEAVPLETLEDDWFVHGDTEAGYRFYAPDAAALLSDAFADGHCFRVEEPEGDAAVVGLAFEPSGRAEGALAGTLWLERETSRLSHLEFGYPNLDLGEHVDTDGLGGRVDFEQLEDGTWIVRRWRIRMPRLERGWVETLTKRELATTLLGYEDEGGEVLAADPTPTRIRRRPPRIVAGTVYDSVAGQPLADALVSVEDASLATRTDEGGSFRIDARDVTFNELRLRVDHPRLDLLGVRIERQVVVGPGQLARLSLGTPSVTTLLRARCPADEREPGTGTVIGLVEHGGTSEPASGVPVVVSWEGDESPVEVRTEPGGFYRACGLPGGAEVSVRAGGATGRAADAVRVRVPTDGLVKVDLQVGGP